MRIEPHANLTITLLERHTFGSDRLQGSVPRRVVPLPHPCAGLAHLRCAPVVLSHCPRLASCDCPPAGMPGGAPGTSGSPGSPGGVVPTGDDQHLSPVPPATVPGFAAPMGSVGNLLDIMA